MLYIFIIYKRHKDALVLVSILFHYILSGIYGLNCYLIAYHRGWAGGCVG
jgi:hypothetical protein